MMEKCDNAREPNSLQVVTTDELPAWHRPEVAKFSLRMTMWPGSALSDGDYTGTG